METSDSDPVCPLSISPQPWPHELSTQGSSGQSSGSSRRDVQSVSRLSTTQSSTSAFSTALLSHASYSCTGSRISSYTSIKTSLDADSFLTQFHLTVCSGYDFNTAVRAFSLISVRQIITSLLQGLWVKQGIYHKSHRDSGHERTDSKPRTNGSRWEGSQRSNGSRTHTRDGQGLSSY